MRAMWGEEANTTLAPAWSRGASNKLWNGHAAVLPFAGIPARPAWQPGTMQHIRYRIADTMHRQGPPACPSPSCSSPSSLPSDASMPSSSRLATSPW